MSELALQTTLRISANDKRYQPGPKTCYQTLIIIIKIQKYLKLKLHIPTIESRNKETQCVIDQPALKQRFLMDRPTAIYTPPLPPNRSNNHRYGIPDRVIV